jgi:hypothetical protein
MNNTSVLETRKVGDFVYRMRAPDKGQTFWTIERQEKLRKKYEASKDIEENAQERA